MKRRFNPVTCFLIVIALLAALFAAIPDLARLRTALAMYRQDYDGRPPRLMDTLAGKKVLDPYLRNLRKRSRAAGLP